MNPPLAPDLIEFITQALQWTRESDSCAKIAFNLARLLILSSLSDQPREKHFAVIFEFWQRLSDKIKEGKTFLELYREYSDIKLEMIRYPGKRNFILLAMEDADYRIKTGSLSEAASLPYILEDQKSLAMLTLCEILQTMKLRCYREVDDEYKEVCTKDFFLSCTDAAKFLNCNRGEAYRVLLSLQNIPYRNDVLLRCVKKGEKGVGKKEASRFIVPHIIEDYKADELEYWFKESFCK